MKYLFFRLPVRIFHRAIENRFVALICHITQMHFQIQADADGSGTERPRKHRRGPDKHGGDARRECSADAVFNLGINERANGVGVLANVQWKWRADDGCSLKRNDRFESSK